MLTALPSRFNFEAIGLAGFRVPRKAGQAPDKAITAMAHKLARIVWLLVKFKQPFNPEVFRKEEEHQQKKKLKRLHHTAASLGSTLVPSQ